MIVPIVDLRRLFGMEPGDYGPTTVVIVVKAHTGAGEKIVGIVVDGVSEVHNVPLGEMRPRPDFGGRLDGEFVRGLATVGDKMLILLDIDTLVATSIGAPLLS